MDKFGIYKIVCKVNNITYIGSTEISFKKRWKKHRQRLNNNYHENSYLQNAWNKYGQNNFIFEIVEELKDTNIVKEREFFWISKYFKKGKKYCFNLSDHTLGGNTIKDEKIRQKLSESLKKSYTPELRELRRIQQKKRAKELAIRLKETTKTEEWKIANAEKNRKLAKDPKWIQKMKEISEHRRIKVGTDKGEIFDSVTEASIQTGAYRSNIRACINGKIKSSMNKKWFYVNK